MFTLYTVSFNGLSMEMIDLMICKIISVLSFGKSDMLA